MYLWLKRNAMKRSKSEVMFAKVDAWKQSGQPTKVFAQSEGLTQSCLEYWIRKQRALPVSTHPFIELSRSIESFDTRAQVAKDQSQSNAPQVVLTFASGLCLKIYG
jgi:hypothetical protein